MPPASLTNSLCDRAESPELSVVVPTRNRPDLLRSLFASIAEQNLESRRFEVLVIDDGSDARQATLAADLAREEQWAFPLALHFQENVGPAAARNRMIERARGPITLFLNDDVTLDPGHFAAHLRFHAAHPEPERVLRGTTLWPPIGRDTALMRFLRSRLFVYDLELPPGEEHFVYFHTCDLSLKTTLLRQYPFDEDFPLAAFEDTELAYRLYRQANMRLTISPEAISRHHHDYAPRDLFCRARLNGRAAAILIEKQPDLRHVIMEKHYNVTRRRRLLRAMGYFATGRMENFWEEIERFSFLRALDHEIERKKRLSDLS